MGEDGWVNLMVRIGQGQHFVHLGDWGRLPMQVLGAVLRD